MSLIFMLLPLLAGTPSLLAGTWGVWATGRRRSLAHPANPANVTKRFIHAYVSVDLGYPARGRSQTSGAGRIRVACGDPYRRLNRS
ncbi:hypothetical protein [Couchioplanes azureus]|uniref:hypothetical protein n=1 Tax=Couchioplanes caeruleus TaxID=56438 RepID=UPI001671618F|nr:hypothetical protein [Couchioplanes caeruleus]